VPETAAKAGPPAGAASAGRGRTAADHEIAHDVRNALNGILLNLEALRTVLAREDRSAEAAGQFLDGAVGQGEALTAIVTRWLSDRRPEASGPTGPISTTATAPASPATSTATIDSGASASPGKGRPTAATPEKPRYIHDLPNVTPMALPRILIADDEPAIAAGLSAVLAGLGYEVEIVPDGKLALERLSAERFGLVLADLRMPKLDGLALLKEMQQREIPTECIIITGQASVGSAVAAMQSGAYDYIEKPLNAEKLDRLKALITKALDKYAVRERNRELASRLEGLTRYAELTGSSEAMREVYRVIDAVAPSTASVLILGESGTGKELVARALHTRSDRAKGPFFALNCAALPKEILENELFGHEKGAFTGSTNEKPGAFEMASGGTLFLDEVAEMPPEIQVKLLRALESRMVRRLGGKKEIAVDIRIVAATNRDLQLALTEGELRDDLYYRLAVVELYLPPLRERAGDIHLLANEFLARFAQENRKPVTGFDDAAMEWILTYSWPGNVRDLKNAVERAVVLATGSVITRAEIMPRHQRAPSSVDTPSSVSVSVGTSLSAVRRELALRTLASTGGDFTRAASTLGISPAELRSEVAALLRDDSSAGRHDESAPGEGDEEPHAKLAAAGPAARPANGKGAGKKLTAKRSR
jgi:DNA-binding NtrC family response regulator